jgi:ectoine hydroxylase-related dioxygenase (phytanoyl-CoA dioxygenase family)
MPIASDIDLDSPYALGADAPDRFAENGFIRLPGLLSPATVRHFEPTITAEVLRLNDNLRPLAERDTYSRAFLQVTNLWRHNETVGQLVRSRRLARVAARLLGVDGVRLYHDQALCKEPGGGITPWHADQYYWPFATDRCVTVWIPLQDTPAELGPLAFAETSQSFEIGRELAISD